MKNILHAMGIANDWVARIGAMSIVAIMVVAVFMRYIMNAPLQWVEEILITIFIWLIMLGAVSSMRVRGHVSIDAFTSLLPLPVQRWIFVFNDIVGIILMIALGWLGLELALDAGDKITPIMMIPYTYIDLAVPVGCFWMALYLVFHCVSDLRGEGFSAPKKEKQA